MRFILGLLLGLAAGYGLTTALSKQTEPEQAYSRPDASGREDV